MLVYNLVVASKARGESDLPLAKLRPRGSTLGLSTTMDTTGPERGQPWGISQAASDRHWSVNKHPGLARRPTWSSVAPDQSMFPNCRVAKTGRACSTFLKQSS